jgi:hemoglobin/transferrin/lactoferrin receptor protein
LGTSIGRTWIAKVDYHFTDLRLSIGTDIRHVESEKNTVSTTAPDKKAYTAVKAYANWQATSDLSLALAANNLLDEFYYDHATYTYVASAGKYAGLPSMGREIVASVSYKF